MNTDALIQAQQIDNLSRVSAAGGAGGHVVISGNRHPIAGRVSMDQLTVDAGDAPVKVGDEVELWGQALPIEEVAQMAQTISYECWPG